MISAVTMTYDAETIGTSKNPYRTLEARCDVSIVDDPGAEFMRKIVTYFGQDFETFHAPKTGRVVVRLTPRHVVTNG